MRELYDAKRLASDKVCVQPPAQLTVEGLCAIDVRHRDDDGLKLQIGVPCLRSLESGLALLLDLAHVQFLSCSTTRVIKSRCWRCLRWRLLYWVCRSGRNAARSSAEKTCGCSHAAKWPPFRAYCSGSGSDRRDLPSSAGPDRSRQEKRLP